jgi:hypothetical protein
MMILTTGLTIIDYKTDVLWYRYHNMSEVQKHRFLWVLKNRDVIDKELQAIKYTSKMDLPTHLDKSDLSIKPLYVLYLFVLGK